jgi:hypothetical protein
MASSPGDIFCGLSPFRRAPVVKTRRHQNLRDFRSLTWPIALLVGAVLFAQLAGAVHQAQHAPDDLSYSCAWCLGSGPSVLPGWTALPARPTPAASSLAADPAATVVAVPDRYSPPVRAPPIHS